MIQTTHGPMDEADLVRSDGVDDDPERFVLWTEYALPGGEVVCRTESGFAKTALTSSADASGMVPTDEQDGRGIVMVPESELDKVSGANDGPESYEAWIEYRRPGSDKVIHRSASIGLKLRNPLLMTQGQVGG